MVRIRSVLPLFLACFAALPAQDPAAAAAREQQLVARAVAGLHGLAGGLAQQKQHGRALRLWRELLTDYADRDEKALDRCGFSKVGDQWRADPQKLVLDRDMTGDPKALKKLDQEWAALQKELAAGHRAVAEAWARADEPGRAMRHWRRVLRFLPGDKAAAAAIAASGFEGFGGSATELGMLRRARTIRGAVDWLVRKQFEVRPLPELQHPLLERAGLAHHGFASEHFQVFGTLSEAQLQQVALHMERALHLCHTLFGVADGAPFAPYRVRNLLLVADDAAYGRVLDGCAGQFDAARLQFLKQEVDLAFLDLGEQSVRLCKTNGSLDEALDQAVRGVVQDASGVFTEGLWEGVGHAACGFFFGRTLTFLLEQQNERTVASPLGKLLVPDMAVWRQIAEQSAWARSDTRTSELVLISAARFTNEQRVKAWAMCDYLFHWRPELLRELERSRTEQVRTPPEVEQEFQRRTGLSLETIDLEWRDFFGRNGELRAAMAADPLGDPKGRERKVREQSRAIVDLVNELRCASLRGPVGFHFAEDLGTAAALACADDLARWEAEQKKPPASRSPKAPKTAPVLPDAVGRTVLFARGADPAAAVSRWACRPAWRDTLLHPGRGLLGARQGGNGLAVDLTDPVAPVTSGLPLCWPRHRQAGVPGSAEVADLGPRVAAALAAVSPPPGPVVGMPITLHFHRELPETELAQVTAAVSADGRNRVGVLVPCQGRGPDDAVPGCVAFVPLEPLPSGAWVEVGWTLPGKLLGKGEHFPVVQFLVQ